MSSLFQHCLGDQYHTLAPIVTRAHQGTVALEGQVWVKHGNALARLLCKLLKMPPQTDQVTLRVHGEHHDHEFFWNRTFGEFEMRSHFVREGAYLVEKLGPLNMKLKLSVEGSTLHYRLQKTTFWGIPIPALLAPKVIAKEGEFEQFYRFSVYVRLPLIGLLVCYGGDMTLIPTEAL